MRRRWSRAGVIVGVVVIAMSLFYPVFATRPRLDQRFEGHPDARHAQQLRLDALRHDRRR